MDNNTESGSSDNPKTSSNMDTTTMYMMIDIKIFINPYSPTHFLCMRNSLPKTIYIVASSCMRVFPKPYLYGFPYRFNKSINTLLSDDAIFFLNAIFEFCGKFPRIGSRIINYVLEFMI